MKYTLRVPTKEQYAYIECEIKESPFMGTEEVVAAYNELTRAVLGDTGLGMKAFAALLVEYIQTGGIPNGGNNEYSVNESLLLGEITKLIRKNK